MRAVRARQRSEGVDGLVVEDVPEPHLAEGDVLVAVHAASFTPGELGWPGTWTDRTGRDRAPSIPGHEVSGEVAALGFGTTGLTVGQRVYGLTDWCRDGTLAERVAVEARNLAPLPAGLDHVLAAALPLAGLTAWQALFDHGKLTTGQTVLVHGAAGGVGSLAVQLAARAGARVIGTGRESMRDAVLELGAARFVDLATERFEDVGHVDLVLDTIGGEILDRSAAVVRAGGRLVTIAAPPRVRPEDGTAVYFIVEPGKARLVELADLAWHGQLRVPVGAVLPLDDAVRAFREKPGTTGKTVIEVVADSV
jgi:NADPH:quinone reductase-like Zn-dependent oxidoreductase